jgi:hypothetical protein
MAAHNAAGGTVDGAPSVHGVPPSRTGSSYPGSTLVRHSIDQLNPNKIFDQMDIDRSSNAPDDLEHAFFEKFEGRNWTLRMLDTEGRWRIRINPVSFFASVALIWGFAVCPAIHAGARSGSSSQHQQQQQLGRC